jgi:hypothetical protein
LWQGPDSVRHPGGRIRRSFGIEIGNGLFDGRLLQRVSGTQTGKRPGALQQDGIGVIGRCAHVAVVKPDQELAGMHQLIVADHDLGDESGNMRRDWSAVAADIRVICTLDEAAGRPPILRVPRGSAGDDQRADDQSPRLAIRRKRNVVRLVGLRSTMTPCIAASLKVYMHLFGRSLETLLFRG